MSLTRRIARPLLGSLFVTAGIDVLRHPERRVAAAAPTIAKLRDTLPVDLPGDDTRVVQLNAAAHLVGGLALTSGRAPRLGALVLAGSLIPTTVAGHAYWKVQDPQQRAMQKIQFDKNMAILGGLLLAAVDTGGRPSLPWRARRAARHMPAIGH